MIDERITEHFKLAECVCPCCDRIKVIPGLFTHMEMLEAMRERAGFNIIINSGYRCLNHNNEINGSVNSWHMLFATDVRSQWGIGFVKRLRGMYKLALVLGFGGIGYYNTFLHLDLRPESTRWRG